jgi:hypothetical protein
MFQGTGVLRFACRRVDRVYHGQAALFFYSSKAGGRRNMASEHFSSRVACIEILKGGGQNSIQKKWHASQSSSYSSSTTENRGKE